MSSVTFISGEAMGFEFDKAWHTSTAPGSCQCFTYPCNCSSSISPWPDGSGYTPPPRKTREVPIINSASGNSKMLGVGALVLAGVILYSTTR